MKRFVAAALLVMLAVLAGPARADAVVLDDVAEALRSNPLYVAPDAERREIDQAAVEEAIGRAGTPVYIAVLPDSARDAAGGDAGEVARQLAVSVDRPGTFGILVGESLRAGSNVFDGASRLAAQAVEDGGDDTTAVLIDFVRLVAESAASGSEGGGGGGDAGTGEDGGVSWVLPVVLVLGAGALGFFLWQRSKRRRAEAEEQARQEAADRQLLAAELSVIADDVVRLEPEVQLHPDAQSDFDSAVNRYRAAQAALDAADEPIDLIRVERVVLEARYSMDRTRAIVDGRPPPDPPDELRQPGRHGEPAVTLDEDRQPTYVGYPGGFQGGWFGGAGGGLFSGMLLGSMLGWGFGGWGYGGGYGGGNEGGGDGGGGDAGGGGDWGGGDFGGGGGDFGGGDFGGGDFGGGDFGG